MPNPRDSHDLVSPAEAWEVLRRGNDRFVNGESLHADQDAHSRSRLASEQKPFVVLFGCSDSRVAAEIIFDRGLGDMFVVRTAGHVVDTTVLGSIEYGVNHLGAPLIVVLGHDNCGAINAARDAMITGVMPDGLVRAVVDRVIPSLVTGVRRRTLQRRAELDAGKTSPINSSDSEYGEQLLQGASLDLIELPEPNLLGREHLRATIQQLSTYSQSLAGAVESGQCAIVGVEYTLADGHASVVDVVGDIGQ